MKIEHVALWVDDLDAMRTFYVTYFQMCAGKKYTNHAKQFTSYFLTFADDKTRLELMHRPDISEQSGKRGFLKGVAHFAVSVGDKQAVDALTERLRLDNYTIESELRTTGDGYYESVVLDPEGNYIEITI